MPKRTYKEIRKAILEALTDGKTHSYGSLERKVDTNWQTIRNQCEDLALFNAVTVSSEGVTITKEGRDAFKRL